MPGRSSLASTEGLECCRLGLNERNESVTHLLDEYRGLIFSPACTKLDVPPLVGIPPFSTSGVSMKSQYRCTLAFALAALLLNSLSCARDQELVGITVQPSAETFLSPDAGPVNLRALGHYIHPVVTKDITDQVTWVSNTPDLVTVDATGQIAPVPTATCGGALVSATVQTNSSAGNRSSSGAIVTGLMVATVNNTAVPGCPGFTGGTLPILTVTIGGTGQGTVTSFPTGLSCTTTTQPCSLAFATGTVITLTATPNGTSTFVGWAPGCDSVSGNMCNLTLNNNRTIGAVFN